MLQGCGISGRWPSGWCGRPIRSIMECDERNLKSGIVHRTGACLLLLVVLLAGLDLYRLWFVAMSHDFRRLMEANGWFFLSIFIWPMKQVIGFVGSESGRWDSVAGCGGLALELVLIWVALAWLCCLSVGCRRKSINGTSRNLPWREFLRLDRILDSFRMPSIRVVVGVCLLSAALPAWVAGRTSFSLHPNPVHLVFLLGGTTALCLVFLLLFGASQELVAALRGWESACEKDEWRPVLFRMILCSGLVCVLTVVAWGVTIQLFVTRAHRVAAELGPLISGLEEYQRAHGTYPLTLDAVPEYDELVQAGSLTVARGNYVGEDRINLAAFEEADAIIYLEADRYQCNVRIRKEARYSSYRFHVLLRTQDDEGWIRHTIWAYRM